MAQDTQAHAAPDDAPAPAGGHGARIALVLISHTNVGKTTLARTLLGQDVGEVRDAAHVTQQSQAHALLSTDEGDELVLWDTPGLGDSARLYRRLAAASNPLGWFLSQVWDRWADRPFFLSQQAMRAARDHADVVLYPVNATEAPSAAGYLDAELKLLQWMERPVLVLLNQTGLEQPGSAGAELQRWRQHLHGAPGVRAVLALDAFTRCWVHERVFFDALQGLVPAALRPAALRLRQAWQGRNVQRFEASMAVIGRQLAAAALLNPAVDEARDGTPRRAGGVLSRLIGAAGADGARRRGQQALQDALEDGRAATTRELLRLHGLLGSRAHPFWKRLEQQDLVERAPLDPVRAGAGGAIASGAATGLAADLASGGLTLGAGALLGALAGAAAFVAGAEGFNRARGVRQASLRLSDAALRALLQDALLKYLAVAHFGRGRGEFEHDALPQAWVDEVQRRVQATAADADALFEALRLDDVGEPQAAAQLQALASRLALELLAWMYPEAQVERLMQEQ